jgi:hypothetical protein
MTLHNLIYFIAHAAVHMRMHMHTHTLTHTLSLSTSISLPVHLILILCNLSLKPSISDRTPDKADRITTFVIVYRYGLADKPEILNGLSSSCNKSYHS